MYLKIVVMLQYAEKGEPIEPRDHFARMLANARTLQRTEGRDRLGPRFHLPHSTTTGALFQHCFAGAFDDSGSDREPG